MRTAATEELPAIEWEKGELLDTHGQSKFYAASGKGDNNWDYFANWVEIDGQFSHIEGIQKDS